jgi:O-antigen/teichoic acid export membrane protein
MIGILRQHLRSGFLGHQLVQGVLGVGGLKLVSLPLTFAASVLLARGLGPTNYGHYSFVMAVIAVLSLPIGPGMGQLITREVARYHHGGQWQLLRGLLRWSRACVLAGSLVAILAIGLAALAHDDWSGESRWTLMVIGSVGLPLMGLSVVQGNTLRGMRLTVLAQLPELLAKPSIQLALAGILLGFGLLTPETAQCTQLAAYGGAVALGAYLLRRARLSEVSRAEPAFRGRDWSRALLPFTLLGAASMLNTQIGILALGWLGTPQEVAALQLAQSGAMLVVFALGIINAVIAPHVARAHRDGNRQRLQTLSRQSARASLALGLPIALPLIFFGGPIVHLVYGEIYTETVAVPLAILAAGQLVNAAFGSVGLFLSMSGHERDTLLGQFIALTVNVLVAVVLIPPFGATGAAVAASLGLVTWNLVLAAKVVSRLHLRPSAL